MDVEKIDNEVKERRMKVKNDRFNYEVNERRTKAKNDKNIHLEVPNEITKVCKMKGRPEKKVDAVIEK